MSISLSDPTEVEAVAAFLRAINAVENIRGSSALDTTVRNATLDEIPLDEG